LAFPFSFCVFSFLTVFALRDLLHLCMDPLPSCQHPLGRLVNIGAVPRSQHELVEAKVPATSKLTALLACFQRW